MRHTGGSFQPWSTCDRCTFQFPVSKLISQNGLKVCTVTCYDNVDIQYRPFIIGEVLAASDQEGVPVTPEIQQAPEEILF